jgi:putative N6-adenine-specific DNA methylase
MAEDCFAQCTPGLEGVLAAELRALGVRAARPDRGGVGFRATTRQLYAANTWLRTANRVLVRVGSFRARTWDELRAGASALDWRPYLRPGVVPELRVTSSRSKLYHTGAIAEHLVAALGGAAPRPGADGPAAQLVVARVLADRVVLSVDSSGEALHRRGWRLEGAKAPLRETLAAAVVLASGWDHASPLVDPFCGSGTIPVEAALVARDLAPGRNRSFAFQGWPAFEPGTWASVRGEVAARARPHAAAPILGSDRDAGAVAAARANAARAEVGEDITFAEAAVSAAVPPPSPRGPAAPGWLLANPPYGGRVRGGDLRDLYARLGDVARRRFPGWGAGLLVADARLAGQARLRWRERLATTNGGIDVRLLVAEVPGLPPCHGDGDGAGGEAAPTG